LGDDKFRAYKGCEDDPSEVNLILMKLTYIFKLGDKQVNLNGEHSITTECIYFINGFCKYGTG